MQYTRITTEQLKAEMSIAGDPDKVIAIMQEMLSAAGLVDTTNPAELINLELAVKRVLAEVRLWKRMYGKRSGQKI